MIKHLQQFTFVEVHSTGASSIELYPSGVGNQNDGSQQLLGHNCHDGYKKHDRGKHCKFPE